MKNSWQNAISLFIRYVSIAEEELKSMAALLRWTFFCSDKSYCENWKKCEPCRWAGKQKTVDSKWFNSYLWRESSKNNFFTLSHVVSEIEKELREMSHSLKNETKILHSLNQNKINIPSKNIISLAKTCDNAKFQFTDREDTSLYNILTGR